ncbi:MAG TPA: amidase family protein [Caulobacteraceae bacterium]|nr:amidase family protein [Caulobacteraceae bacterium]
MDDILKLDATGQLAALAGRQISAVELLEAALKRCEAVNGALNAVVARDPTRAVERARAIDDQRAKGGGDLPPLAGLPMTIKDTFDVVGLPASSGLEVFRQGSRPDATCVAHARRAGAVIWGKTNTPVMAGDFQTFNALYGTTNNPWDLTRTSGGSSGGAAAALAARITALEIGSDIGGSLRTPASFCGVYSHKPTWGRVSQIGHIPPLPGAFAQRDLNVVGPMARSARDLRLLLGVIDGGAGSGAPAAVALKGLRIGLWTDQPEFVLDPQVRSRVEGFAADLAREGAAVTPISSPVDCTALLAAYRTLLAGVLAEDLPPETLKEMQRSRPAAEQALAAGAGPDSGAALALGYTQSHLEWMAANEVRARLAAGASGLFDRFDVLLAPIGPVPAFPHDHRPFEQRTITLSNGDSAPYLALLRWIALATACGLPATAIPIGRTAAGLPVGAQLIGPRGGDDGNLAVAEAIEAALGGFEAPPDAALQAGPDAAPP